MIRAAELVVGLGMFMAGVPVHMVHLSLENTVVEI